MGMGFTIELKYTMNGSFEMKDVIIVINYMVDAKVIFKCPIDYGDFPFHSVICKLRITSFTKSNTSMVFHSAKWSDSEVETRGYIVDSIAGYSFRAAKSGPQAQNFMNHSLHVCEGKFCFYI